MGISDIESVNCNTMFLWATDLFAAFLKTQQRKRRHTTSGKERRTNQNRRAPGPESSIKDSNHLTSYKESFLPHWLRPIANGRQAALKLWTILCKYKSTLCSSCEFYCHKQTEELALPRAEEALLLSVLQSFKIKTSCTWWPTQSCVNILLWKKWFLRLWENDWGRDTRGVWQIPTPLT